MNCVVGEVSFWGWLVGLPNPLKPSKQISSMKSVGSKLTPANAGLSCFY